MENKGMDNKKKKDRREFLRMGLVIGGASLAGSQIPAIAKPIDKGEPKKFITATGEVVEVNEKFLKQSMRKKPISNAELKQWMEKNHKSNEQE